MSYWKDKKVLVTGGHGFVGTSVVDCLSEVDGIQEIFNPTKNDFDLRVEDEVDKLFRATAPDVVLHLAGKVGGIGANKSYPGTFFYDNIMMGTLVMEYARKSGVSKLVALAAGCGYPLGLDVPYKETDFWKDLPQPESMGYSMGKKMLIVQSLAYRTQYGFNSSILLPCNLYGPRDNFDLENSHVIPALIRKFVEAKNRGSKTVEVWGSGKATREFLYVDDTARAILNVAEKYNDTGPLNLGVGVETTILELVHLIKSLVGFEGDVSWDSSRPDGQPRRFYDMSLFKKEIGYVPSTTLEDGLKKTIEWYISHGN